MPAPPGAARRTGVGLGLLLAVGLFAGGAELARRSAGWFRPAAVVPFRVVVPAGDAVVRRGDAVTLSAYLDPTAADVPLPAVVELETRPGPGEPETRRRMTPDPTTGAAVTVLPPPAADFEYRVVAGQAASEWFTVRVADPVELAPGTAVELTPPAYAAATVKPRTLPGFADLDALVGSTAVVRFRFTRPAATAALEWRPDAQSGLPETLPVALDADALGGTATLLVREPGVLRLVLANETGVRKLRTERPVRVRARPDEPPRFAELAGFHAGPRAVLPGQLVVVTVTVTDDVAVTGAELEVAGGPGFATVTRLPFPLTGAGTPTAEGRLTLDPAALGGVFRVRLRAADARPNSATYPADGWAEWRVAPTAPPADEQEVRGPAGALAAQLIAGKARVREAIDALAPLATGPGAKGVLPVDHAARLATARVKAGEAGAVVRDAARDATRFAVVRPFAESIRTLADGTVSEADDFLRRAATDDPADRRAALDGAQTRLQQAERRADELCDAIDRAAQARLDADRLAALAADYTTLADRAATGADVAAERTRLAARFDAILSGSHRLRDAVAGAAGAERRELALRAEALAAAARDLDAVADRLAADVRTAVGTELAAAQALVSDRAAATIEKLGTAARLARVTLPDPAAFRAAGEHLAGGRGAAALTELEKSAQALDRAAEGFARPPFDPADGKAVAHWLGLWQDDIRGRAAGFAGLPDAAKAAVRAEQRALHAAAGRLNLPADPMLAAVRDEARVHLATATARLDTDPAAAEQPMRLAADALARLVADAPAAADRLTRTRPDFDRLRADHDTAASAVETVLRSYDRQVPDETVRRGFASRVGLLLVRYEPLAARLAALDLPGFEARRHAAVAALRAAAADLRAGLPLDAAASLAAARRALDRLRDALNGQPPADAVADELARLQADLVIRPDAAAQKLVADRLTGLAAPEAAALLHDAREAAKGKDARRAADVLAALADRLTGRRSDAERLLTFVAARTRAAAVARAKAGQPRNPPASNEEQRQLGREAEELGHVRVGPAGQVPKRRALDAYTRLAGQAEPDRDAAGQAQLADVLAELAAAAAGVADGLPPPHPVEPDPAAGYLPSPRLAAVLSGLAAEQRAVRDRAKGADRMVEDRLKPSGERAFDDLERRLREVPGARPAADRLRAGDARTAGTALAAAPGVEATLLAEVRALAADTRAAAARQAARARELAADADALAAAVAAADQPAAVRAAAELARRAARSLAAAAERTDAADPVGSDRHRGEASAALARLIEDVRGEMTGGAGAGPGRALRAAASVVRAGDLRRAAAALAEAARAAAP